MPAMFLGRTYDVNTATWQYADGSGGAMPEEVRIDFMSEVDGRESSFLRAYNHVWRWKSRQKQQERH